VKTYLESADFQNDTTMLSDPIHLTLATEFGGNKPYMNLAKLYLYKCDDGNCENCIYNSTTQSGDKCSLCKTGFSFYKDKCMGTPVEVAKGFSSALIYSSAAVAAASMIVSSSSVLALFALANQL
jgi:hypothetical protein